jgi:dihydrofolate reductase
MHGEMIISLIVAMDESRGIGKVNRIPWRLSADLKRFKAVTMGHHLIMGRKTYESIGKPLPGRKTVVITRNPNYLADGCRIAHSLQEALEIARTSEDDEAFVIGGGEIFNQALPLADRIHLTQVCARLDCDTFFPEIYLGDWRIAEESFQPADKKNEFASTYQLLFRK